MSYTFYIRQILSCLDVSKFNPMNINIPVSTFTGLI